MKTVQREYSSIFEEKRSIFRAHIVPYRSFDDTRKRLIHEHPKANHIVYAFRHLDELGRIEEGSSDDGEPKGCAGVPVLNVMRGEDLVDCAVLVVRYFGGVKLGTGGMARAYSSSALSVVEEAKLEKYIRMYELSFACDYSLVQMVEYRLRRLEIETLQRSFRASDVLWRVSGSRDSLDDFVTECDRVNIDIEVVEDME
jgi:uncharacterized YigZ family protein